MSALEHVAPIKVVRDKRIAYLASLSKAYEDLGYTVLLDGIRGILEVFEKGAVIDTPLKSIVLDKWLD